MCWRGFIRMGTGSLLSSICEIQGWVKKIELKGKRKSHVDGLILIFLAL